MTRAIDAVTLEIISGKLLAVADEMGIVLARTSMSPVIYEVLDFACGICDEQGPLIAQSNGITLFTGTFSSQVQFIKRKFGRSMRPGDIFMTNDPFEGGTHTADIALIKPVYVDGVMQAFAIAVAHWIEVGGSVAGSLAPDATEIFQEGLRFPGIHICREDRLQQDIVDLIEANVRLPRMSLGDLNAELAAVRIADTRLQEVCAKYGVSTLREVFAKILATSARQSRMAVAALPDGIYTAEDWIDGDGNTDEQIPVRVAVRIAGDRMTFDFTGSSPQRRAPVNCSRGSLLSGVKTIFKALVDPQAPSNEGWFRPVELIIPDGTVFSAVPPAPVGWYYEGSAQASELVWKALADLAPDRFSAGSYMSLCAAYICGKNPKTGDMFVHVEPHHGGWGATRRCDGSNALIAVTDGDTYNYSLELLEAKFPLRVHRYGLNVEEGSGAGRYRGGFGTVREYEILTDDAFLYASLGRSIERPWALNGGKPGTTNYIDVCCNGAWERRARVPHLSLRPGDRVRIVTGGGGGYGLPMTRPPDEVLDDFHNDYISVERAREDYGVVIDEAGCVDADRTAKARQAIDPVATLKEEPWAGSQQT